MGSAHQSLPQNDCYVNVLRDANGRRPRSIMRRLFRHHRRPRCTPRANAETPGTPIVQTFQLYFPFESRRCRDPRHTPGHLRTLACVSAEWRSTSRGPVTQRSMLDALEVQYRCCAGPSRPRHAGAPSVPALLFTLADLKNFHAEKTSASEPLTNQDSAIYRRRCPMMRRALSRSDGVGRGVSGGSRNSLPRQAKSAGTTALPDVVVAHCPRSIGYWTSRASSTERCVTGPLTSSCTSALTHASVRRCPGSMTRITAALDLDGKYSWKVCTMGVQESPALPRRHTWPPVVPK